MQSKLAGHVPPSPPPDSWASRSEADAALWHVVLEPGASWTMPAASGADTVRVLYVFQGDGLAVAGEDVDGSTGAVVDATRDVELTSTGHVELLVMQGRPIGEPVAMQAAREEAELEEAPEMAIAAGEPPQTPHQNVDQDMGAPPAQAGKRAAETGPQEADAAPPQAQRRRATA